MLTGPERERIEAAIRDVERRTAGEIVVVVARQAASYRSVPIAGALGAALVTPWVLLAATSLGFGTILVVQSVVAVLALAGLGPNRIRAALVPRFVRRARAREAAQREFVARGLAETRGRTGILIYVAMAERHAEVIGDLAISAKVPPERWRDTVDALVAGLRRSALCDGLAAAIDHVGPILVDHLPIGIGDTDELPNRVVVI